MRIVNFVDAPDPDNFVQILAAKKLFPSWRQDVVLTGRPVKFKAEKGLENWEWDYRDSRMAQEASAMRVGNFLKHYDINELKVHDGGIAPRTLVPHWIHFEEYYKFLDVDPLAAIRHSELLSQEELVKQLLECDGFHAVVGGPMTGLKEILERQPEIAGKIKSVHAMFATWGEVQLMQMDDKPRGALQFNAACDPFAAYSVLEGLTCPIYMIPSECTRLDDIAFVNAQELRDFLPDTPANNALYTMYCIWYDAAVKPRLAKNPDEKIFIHDLCSALALYDDWSDAKSPIYDFVPVKVTVPHLACDREAWGQVIMERVKESNVHCATKVANVERYRSLLKEVCS